MSALSLSHTAILQRPRACRPEIVRAPDERGCCLGWRERSLPCGSPHLRVGGLLQGATAATLKYPVLSFHPVAIDVFAENADECWRDRHPAHLVSRPVLEAALVTGAPIVRPTLSCARFRGRQIQTTPSRLRQNTVMATQGDRLGRPQPGIVGNGE